MMSRCLQTPFRRVQVWCVLWTLVGWLPGGAACVRAEDAAGTAAASPAPETKLPPESEKKLAEALAKVAAPFRKSEDEKTNEAIEALTTATHLSDDQAKAVRQAASEAEDASIKDFKSKLGKMWRAFFLQNEEQFTAAMDSMPDEMPNVDESLGQLDVKRALDQESWKTALQRILTPAQAETWTKAEQDRKPKIDAETQQYLATQQDKAREQAERAIGVQTSAITRILKLPKERSDQLDALAKSAAEKSAEVQLKTVERQILSMDKAQRHLMIKGGGTFYASDAEKGPDRQAVWTDGIAKLLTDDERALLKKNEDTSQQRRAGALGKFAVALLDEKIAFTASQREQLQPIVERAVREDATLFSDRGSDSYASFGARTFYQAAGQAREEDVRKILDATQWEHWRKLCQKKNNAETSDDEDSDESRIIRRPKPAPKNTPPPSKEPEETENAISDFLAKKVDGRREKLVAAMTVEAEDATRVGGLSASCATALQTAARGAVEQLLVVVKAELESIARSQVGDARPETVRRKLAGIQQYYFNRDRLSPPDKEAVWTKTVSTTMNEAQRAAWQKEVDLRQKYRIEAIAGYVTAAFDAEVKLTPEQWDVIQPKLSGIILEYSEDLGSYFSSSYETAWYFQSYTMLMPLGGIPEEEFKQILGKAQWESWTSGYSYSNALNFWQNAAANHKDRAKAKEDK